MGFDLVFSQRQKIRDINFLPIVVAIALSPVDDERNNCWWVVHSFLAVAGTGFYTIPFPPPPLRTPLITPHTIPDG
jgi:hypothetical protein